MQACASENVTHLNFFDNSALDFIMKAVLQSSSPPRP